MKRHLAETAKRLLLEGLYFSGGYRLFESRFAGLGTILMFHRVSPDDTVPFAREMYTSQAFLDAILSQVRRLGWDIVDLDEVHRRLNARTKSPRRFVCFTFDDGYRDNMTLALPIFRRHQAPMTIYVCTGLIDRTADYWWGVIEEKVARDTALKSPGQKEQAYKTLTQARHANIMAASPAEESAALLDRDMLSWQELEEIAQDPLVSLQAHTIHHWPTAQLAEATARQDMLGGKTTLADKLGIEPKHFAYPYGAPKDCGPRDFAIAADLGFKTATTTRKGNIFAAHNNHLTCLPRIPVGSKFSSTRHIRVHLSGATVAIANRFAPMVTT
ncbi:MAG: polysaccharide deacetylase family protein [Alphaproteobacteria bacterium]